MDAPSPETSIMIVILFFALFVSGCGYAAFVDWQGDRKDGYLSLYVALGVLFTIGGMAALEMLVSWPAWLIALACFTATGSPMVAGEVLRNQTNRAKRKNMEIIAALTPQIPSDEQ